MSSKWNKRKPHHEAVRISNDLGRLIPVGTLDFYNLPFDCIGFASMSTGQIRRNGWRWVDLEMMEDTLLRKSHPYVKELYRMIKYRYVMASFKPIKLEIKGGNIVILRVRLYVIPHDIDGFRFFDEFRRTKSIRLANGKEFGNFWNRTLTMLDYSHEGWNPSRKMSLTKFCRLSRIIIPFYASNNSSLRTVSNNCLNFHIERWLRNGSYEIFLEDGRTNEPLDSRLQRIYTDIQSPHLKIDPEKVINGIKDDIPNSQTQLSKISSKLKDNDLTVDGLKSTLYPFQMESLGKMLEMETTKRRCLVPDLIEVKAPHMSKSFYYNMINNKVYIFPEIYDLPRGGILAENMGLGKTLICLSLICVTKFEVSTIPDDELIYYEDVTSVTQDSKEKSSSPNSLFNICKGYILQNSLPWKFYIDRLPGSLVDSLLRSQGTFQIPLDVEKKARISSRSRNSEKILESYREQLSYHTLYLCSTTLIVVPDSLFHQWNSELKKHCDDSYLRKLFISSHFTTTRCVYNSTYTNEIYDDVNDIASFDLILITLSQISRHADTPYSENPLHKMYWKRLIIDEGHVMHSKSSRASALCKNLKSQSRWAITGTPTSGLTRLYVNEKNDEESTHSPKKNQNYVVKNKFDAKEDLIKLGNILSNFLKIEPFHSQPKLWNQNIVKPLTIAACGSHRSLSNILNGIVVRHNLNEKEVNLKLPQLHHVPVFLEPSYHNKLSINLFTAVLAVNAVSSERKDIDYMFHPANRQQLRKLISNLQRATFYWTSFKQEDVETLISICDTSLKKRKVDGTSVIADRDVELLKKSKVAAESALKTTSWNSASSLHEMNYYVSNLSNLFVERYGMGSIKMNDDDESRSVGIFGAPQLTSVQNFFYKNRFGVSNDVVGFVERFKKHAEEFWKNYWSENSNVTAKGLHKEESKHEQEQYLMHKPDLSSDISSKKYSLAMDVPVSFQPKKSPPEDNEPNLIIDSDYPSEDIKLARIIGTGSSKLSYLASRLLENKSQRTKSIVFYEFEDSAYYLTELLDITGIDYILYSTSISPAQRANNLSEFDKFSTATGGVALIMDLKLASHGLTITAATRVYFMSPVWQRSMEAQAIKRAHRIGQNKEVFVETLILRGTLEEEIYKRRTESSESQDQENSQHQYVIDDRGMQEFILKHQFVDLYTEGKEYSEFITSAHNLMDKFNDGDEYSDTDSALPHHHSHSTISPSQQLIKWIVYLFTKENLEKISQMKNLKIQKAHFEEQFVNSFMSNTDTSKEDTKNPRKMTNVEKRKKVRF